MPAVNASVIRDRRQELRVPLADLASQCGITESHLDSIETGRQNCSIVVGQRIARNLGISPKALSPQFIDPACARTIRERRQVAGWNRSELASKLEISPRHLDNIETGRRRPSTEVLDRMASYLGCAVEDLCEPARTAA